MKIRKLLILTGLLALLGGPLGAQEEDSAFIRAVSRFNEGDYTGARSVLSPLTRTHPEDDAVWYYLGMTEAGLGHLDQAVECLETAVRLDGKNYWYRDRLATVYKAQGNEDGVLNLYEAMVEDFPDKPQVWFDLLSLYLKKGQFEKALNALQEVENVTGTSEQTARTRYDIYRNMDRPDEAIQSLVDFSEQYTSAPILSMMGDHYLSDYEDSLALVCYEEALQAESNYVPALLGKSEVYRTTMRYPEYFETVGRFMDNPDEIPQAKSIYMGNVVRSLDPKFLRLHQEQYDDLVSRMLAVHPVDSSILSTAGTYYYATGRIEKAGSFFGKAVELYPGSIQMTATYVQFQAMEENWPEVRAHSLSAWERFHDPGFLEYARMAAYNLEDYDAVIEDSRFMLKEFASDSQRCVDAYATLGDMYHLKGDSKAAYKSYEKALKLNPDYAPVLNNYAYYLSLEGKKLKKAYEMSKKTVEAEPDNATYLDTFAWILHLQGKDIEAKPLFKHAMVYGGKDSAVMLDHYAEVLYALGEYDLAKVYWNQARQKDKTGEIPDLEERIEARLNAIPGK